MPPPVPPPVSTVEQFPDPVSMRLTFRRYHSEPAEWQVRYRLHQYVGIYSYVSVYNEGNLHVNSD